MVIKNLNEYGFNTKNRTYIIAEIGLNHNGSIKVAKDLIDSAARTGVDAVKFQTYLTEKRAPDGNIELFNLLKNLELPFNAFLELKQYTEENHNLDFFSTAFDNESVEFLETIDMSMYKIASFDICNHGLLNKIAKTGKPVILSVGMSKLNEIEEAYRILKKNTNNVALLHCISSYPTKESDALLSNIYELYKSFDCVIGQSDHTNGIKVPIYAAACGAQIIEKHFKINNNFNCVDSPVSITEKQMTELVKSIRDLEAILGESKFGIRPTEENTVVFRRKSII